MEAGLAVLLRTKDIKKTSVPLSADVKKDGRTGRLPALLS